MRKMGRLCSHHNRPLYLTAHIHNEELRHVMIDLGSSPNIMPLSMLETMGIRLDRIVKQPIDVSSFEGNASFTLSFLLANIMLVK